MLCLFVQLRSIYDVVKAVRNNPSWEWDNKKGANITLASKGAWEEYVAAYPKAAPFHNNGWPHLTVFDALASACQGPSVLRSSQPAHGPRGRGGSPIGDEPESQTQVDEKIMKPQPDDEGKVSVSISFLSLEIKLFDRLISFLHFRLRLHLLDANAQQVLPPQQTRQQTRNPVFPQVLRLWVTSVTSLLPSIVLLMFSRKLLRLESRNLLHCLHSRLSR